MPRLPRRGQAKEQSAAQGECQTCQVYAHIHTDFQMAVGRLPPVEHTQQQVGAGEARGSAHKERMTASVSSCRTRRRRLDPRATRRASSWLRSAVRAANRAGQIRAGRRQHQQRQHGHAPKKSADDVTFVAEEPGMNQPQWLPVVGLRILLRQPGRNRIQIFGRLPRGDAGLIRPITVTAIEVRLCR